MNRRVILLTGAATAALLTVWFFALWQPKGAALTEQRERLAAAEDAGDVLRTKIVRLEAAKADGPKLAATRDRLRSAVPDDPRLAQFILDANEAAVSAGVEFVSIAPQEPSPASQPGLPPEVRLAVDVEGGYFQVLDFVERLMDLQRVVVIDAVNVTPQGDGDAPELTATLQGRMFTIELPLTSTPATAAPAAQAAQATTSTTVVNP